MHTKIQSDIFSFGCAMVNKPGKVMSLFELRFLTFVIVVRKSKSHFWNPEIELDKMGVFLEENFEFRNLT